MTLTCGSSRSHCRFGDEPRYLYGRWIERNVRVRFRLLSSLRQSVGESELVVEFAGGSVESLVKEAGNKYPKLGEAIFAKDGSIDYAINVILNERPLTESAMKETVRDGDEVTLLAAAAGG